jgi:hypothetical protein
MGVVSRKSVTPTSSAVLVFDQSVAILDWKLRRRRGAAFTPYRPYSLPNKAYSALVLCWCSMPRALWMDALPRADAPSRSMCRSTHPGT